MTNRWRGPFTSKNALRHISRFNNLIKSPIDSFITPWNTSRVTALTQACDLLRSAPSWPSAHPKKKKTALPSLLARGMSSGTLNRCHCELETDGNEGSPLSGSPCSCAVFPVPASDDSSARGRPDAQEDSAVYSTLAHPPRQLTSTHTHTYTHTQTHCKGANRRGFGSSISLQECERTDLSEDTSGAAKTPS